MRNIALVIEYDGSDYHGWQCQPNGITVEEVLRGAVARILDHDVKVYAGGRTDAGVHALGQVVNFHTAKDIPLESLKKGLNSMLPEDIGVKAALEVDQSFHARYSARSKVYSYTIANAPFHSPFHFRYSWHIPYAIDSRAMDEAIKSIKGEHDFSAFKKRDEIYRSTVRNVLLAGVKKRGEFVYIIIEAMGFLRYMIRNIVGTLVLVGKGKLQREDFVAILESKDRVNAGPTAPAKGLFLRRIRY
ncbi:MAG TPA: tRNA pseudouridine(38-40) synthase TruA [Syntrophorhabdaceae bacterium]|nr:tRNA pseudouridine(38-40) synthase TruA [Syntrophorhabdaceae bacterium]HQM81464.1 tRNA pseudouridine(38-40) synthase TruA [Syntrophorhabdaceae bacterium]